MTIHTNINRFLEQHQTDMLNLLEQLVLIQSGSYHKKGVDQVGRQIAEVLAENQLDLETVHQDDRGDHLVARSPAVGREPVQMLLVGHMDTVFPRDTAFNWFKQDHTHCYGPGVADMKGGLVVGIYALKALDACGFLDRIPVTFVFNSDEEIGSGSSRELIKAEARKSILAMVLECGGPDGEIVTGRKGNLSVRITIKGKAGHAAFAPPDKGSAILELAHKIIEVEKLNNPEKDITANVGWITGGIGPNTVPELAEARADFRFVRPEDYSALQAELERIVQPCQSDHTTAAINIVSQRPPMPESDANRRLFDIVQQVAQSMGLTPQPEFRQGVSDANLIAAENTPVIDGMGTVGGNDHSDKEFMVKGSLLQRAQLIANSLVECWRRPY